MKEENQIKQIPLQEGYEFFKQRLINTHAMAQNVKDEKLRELIINISFAEDEVLDYIARKEDDIIL